MNETLHCHGGVRSASCNSRDETPSRPIPDRQSPNVLRFNPQKDKLRTLLTMKTTKKARPKARTQTPYTSTVRKIACHILQLIAQRPPGELLELTQREIADSIGVCERSVIRAMPLLHGGIEHVGRGFWRANASVLRSIALDPQKTPHNDDRTPARPLAPIPSTAVGRSRSIDPHQSIDFAIMAQRFARLEEKVARLENRTRVRPTLSAAARLKKWITALGLPDERIATRLRITPHSLNDYANNRCTPPPAVRERIRARTGISTQAWDTPTRLHTQRNLDFGS